ncbi:MAG: DUF3108 domain-containing protein [Paludibacteraceae bacterium]|nr:DUF3108 domain-containing protein [Paludibacteraceae bacterium]
MKLRNVLTSAVLFAMTSSAAFAQTNSTYKYKLSYGIITGGSAVVTTTPSTYNGHPAVHTSIVGRTIGLIDKLYKVYDVFESTYDDSTFMPYCSTRNIHEGKHTQFETAVFYHNDKVVNSSLVGMKEIEPDARDMVSGMLRLCNVDFGQYKSGDVLTFNVYHEKNAFPIHVKYKGIETIKVNKKQYTCYRVAPMVDPGDLFKEKDGLNMWISTDDSRKIVYAKLNFSVGSFKLTLDE